MSELAKRLLFDSGSEELLRLILKEERRWKEWK